MVGLVAYKNHFVFSEVAFTARFSESVRRFKQSKVTFKSLLGKCDYEILKDNPKNQALKALDTF